MLSSVLSYLSNLFSWTSGFFNIKFVGTNWTILQVMLGALITCFVISIVHNFIGITVGASAKGLGYRSSNNHNVKVDERRRNDYK